MSQFKNGYTLLVGADENAVPKWALPEVAKDVEALRKVLVHPGRCAYPDENVRVITGEAATRQGILGGLEWLQERVEADDSGNATAVVYYTGHGLRQGTDYYLLPYDAREGRIASRGLRAEDFAAEIEALAPRRLLVVLDCCHAGGMGVKDPLSFPTGYQEAAIPPTLLMGEGDKSVGPGAQGAKGMAALAQGQGRAVLSSSSGTQRSYLRKDGKMSIFTYHLIEALTGHAQPQGGATQVLVSDVMSHVWRRVPQSARADRNAEQTPDYQVSGNFPIALLLGGKGLHPGQPAPDPLEALEAGVQRDKGRRVQTVTNSSHVAQAMGDGATAIVGDSNRVTNIRQQAGDGAIQIGQARDVDVSRDE